MSDYISRDAVMDKIANMTIRPIDIYEQGIMAGVHAVKECITNLPSADVAPVVHGKWVMKETMIRSPFAKNAYCSECLEETSFLHNYCPNCGAKMDGE